MAGAVTKAKKVLPVSGTRDRIGKRIAEMALEVLAVQEVEDGDTFAVTRLGRP